MCLPLCQFSPSHALLSSLQEMEPGIQSIYLGPDQTSLADLGWQYHEWTHKSVLQRIEYARSGNQLLGGGAAPLQIQFAALKVGSGCKTFEASQ